MVEYFVTQVYSLTTCQKPLSSVILLILFLYKVFFFQSILKSPAIKISQLLSHFFLWLLKYITEFRFAIAIDLYIAHTFFSCRTLCMLPVFINFLTEKVKIRYFFIINRTLSNLLHTEKATACKK